MTGDAAPMLPGLEAPARPPQHLEAAVRRTLADLERRGLLAESDAGKMALCLELAQVITVKRTTGRASTIGNDARVLMELLDGFTPDAAESDADAALRQAMAAWADELEGTP